MIEMYYLPATRRCHTFLLLLKKFASSTATKEFRVKSLPVPLIPNFGKPSRRLHPNNILCLSI